MVAGVAALVFSVNPNLTGSQVQDILKQSADDLGTAGWDPNFGWGRVNAARAVSLATGGGATTDTTPPTVSFSSPSLGAAVSGTVTVSVSSADNVGVSSVSLKVDGASLGSDTVAPYGFSWNTSSLSNGQHTLMATASDAVGNTSSASISVTVSNFSDTTPPTVTLTSPVMGGTLTGSVSILVNTADAVGVTRVDLYVDGRVTSTSTSSPFTNKWNTRKVTAGAHIIQCKAYDAAGNVGLSNSVTVYR